MGIPLPIIQFRKHIPHICPHLLRRKLLICHVAHTDIDQIIHVVIHILAVGIAPLAVFLIEDAVGFSADHRVFHRHSAALADQLTRRAEDRIDGNTENLGQQFQRFNIGCRFSVFPAGYRLPGYKNPLSQFILRQSVLRSQVENHVFCVHQISPQNDCTTLRLHRQATGCCCGVFFRKRKIPAAFRLSGFWCAVQDSYGLSPSHALRQPKIHRAYTRIFGASWVEPQVLARPPDKKSTDPVGSVLFWCAVQDSNL